MTLEELLQQYGDKTFGGDLGLLKTERQDLYDGSGLSGINYARAITDLAERLSSEEQKKVARGAYTTDNDVSQNDPFAYLAPRQVGNSEDTLEANLNRPQYQYLRDNPEFMTGVNSINERFGKLNNKIQITPELYQSTLAHNKNPEGFEGEWINPAAQIKYDPQFGAYLSKDDPYGNYGLDGYRKEWEGNFFAETFSDPLFMLPLAYAGAVAGGMGAFGGSATGSGSAGAGLGTGLGEAAGSTAYGLGSGSGSLGFNAGGFLGGAGATPGVGFVAPSAAGWGGFGAGTLGTGLGTIGAVDYGLGAGTGNLGFNASGAFGGTSTLGGTAGSGLGIGVPQGAGWWGAGSGVAQAVPTGSLFDTLKANYDKYGKPVSQANSALKMLGGGGPTGTGGMMQPQESSIPLPAGGGVMQGGGGYPGLPVGGYPGLPGAGVIPQQNNSPEQDWFIPEYLRRGVIGR